MLSKIKDIRIRGLFSMLLPRGIRDRSRFIRMLKPLTRIFGPLYKLDHLRCQLVITYDCDLKCINCDESCRQAPSKEQMSLEQIEKFIKESIAQKIKWEIIQLTGGEPALHPDLQAMLEKLMAYKKDFSPDTAIEVLTNGFAPEKKNLLMKIPAGVNIISSHKQSIYNKLYPFNIAPIDSWAYKLSDYANGCDNLMRCGMVMTPYGYYPCAAGGGIDRVFGFDVGAKKMPSPNDEMRDKLRVLCKYCGHFRRFLQETTNEEKMSPVWKKAYGDYQKKKPALSRY